MSVSYSNILCKCTAHCFEVTSSFLMTGAADVNAKQLLQAPNTSQITLMCRSSNSLVNANEPSENMNTNNQTTTNVNNSYYHPPQQQQQHTLQTPVLTSNTTNAKPPNIQIVQAPETQHQSSFKVSNLFHDFKTLLITF